jgi:peptidyl-prolyl cis-trans isomerase A (cyclophilin A)
MKPSLRRLLAAVGLSALTITSAHAGPKVLMKTNQGDITIELNEEKAPETVKNFLAYVNEGFFDKTVFHRVIDGFMIQGGGFALKEDGSIEQKETKAPIQNEAKNGLKNKKGTIAMARTGDPHSATAQFFINHKDNDNLDYPSFDGWGYAVFGEVVGGAEVIEKIAKSATGTKTLKARAGDALREAPMDDVPNENVVIESVKVVTE